MLTLENNNTISIFFSGDLCVSTPIKDNYISSDLFQQIKKHDYRSSNWEAPIIKSEFAKSKKAGPHIHQDNSFKIILESDLFNLFALANNHICDYGKEGLDLTIRTLTKFGETFGASTVFEETYKPLIIEKNGLKIALFSFGENQFGCQKTVEQDCGYAWMFSYEVEKQIKSIKDEVNFIICLPHAGLEMEELPLPEFRAYYKQLIDYGADLIIGTHPHVIQPKEKYKNKWIYYSLGNFLFNSYNNDSRWNNSLGLSCVFDLVKKEITIKEHFLSLKNNQIIEIDLEDKFHQLNQSIINENDYIKKINQICLDVWNKYYRDYYIFGDYRPLFNNKFYKLNSVFQKIVAKIVMSYTKPVDKTDTLMLYHNISIESHRFCVERALRQINQL